MPRYRMSIIVNTEADPADLLAIANTWEEETTDSGYGEEVAPEEGSACVEEIDS